jgi:hypothetical protein
MNFRTIAVMAGLVAAALAAPQSRIPVRDALANGEFRAPLDSGWTASNQNIVGSHSFRILKDGGARISKTMCGTASLSQVVRLPNPNFVFASRARFAAEVNKPDYGSHAAIVLGYQDKDGNPLGETRIVLAAGTGAPASTTTRHVIPVAKANAWADYSINLADELRANLKGIVPARVNRVLISYEAYGSGTSAC